MGKTGAGFWNRVDALLALQKSNSRWLAGEVKSAETTISGWRRLERSPKAEKAFAIAKALGVTVEYLVSGEDSELSIKDRQLLNKARKFASVIEDLDAIDNAAFLMLATQIHAVAESVRSREDEKKTGGS